MKTFRFPLAFAAAFSFCSCQKELSFTATVPTEQLSTETTYLTLGSWDEFGRPNYLLAKDVITTDLNSFINNILPERSDLFSSHPELLSSRVSADIAITQTSDVYITYISQGAGMTNTVGFYTYPTNTPPLKTTDIKTITYIFPNAGYGSTLESGDKVKIGRFKQGTSIGFVLLQSGWNSTTRQLENKVVHFYSTDILNPEPDPGLKKHAVSITYAPENKVLIGFEDLDRTRGDCDHDFNDVLIFATLRS
jgi:hypothetical protein